MKMKHLGLTLALAGMLSTQAYAGEAQIEALQPAAPVAAFTDADLKALFEHADKPMRLAALSDAEMRETEGAVAPLVAIGVMTAGRFIAQRYVTERVAQAMVQKGATNVMAATRSQAKNIAGRNAIREFHPGPGARYTHYHPATRNGSHVWYGHPR